MRTRQGLLSSAGHRVAMATIAVLIMTMSEPPPAIAGSAAPASKGISATTASSDATDFSAARRRRYYRRGDAAGLAIFGMAIGTMAAIAAQQNYGYGLWLRAVLRIRAVLRRWAILLRRAVSILWPPLLLSALVGYPGQEPLPLRRLVDALPDAIAQGIR